jgi:DNA-binding HxlR family transcriptional regulator
MYAQGFPVSSSFPKGSVRGTLRGVKAKAGVDPHCKAYQSAIDLLARPWTGLILQLLQVGPCRFGELEERTRGIGAKTLSARLKELEARGVIGREVDPGPPVRVTYRLTEKGRGFEQVASAIERWGRELLAN